jgi:hypothetical protein
MSQFKIILVDERNYEGLYEYKLFNDEKPKGWVTVNKNDLANCKAAREAHNMLRETIDDVKEFDKYNTVHLSPSVIMSLQDMINKSIRKAGELTTLKSELCWYRSRLDSLYQTWIATNKKGHFYYIEKYETVSA